VARMPRAPRRLALCFAALGLLGARQAHASPEDILGFGPRSMALGATGAASAEGYEAVYNNPALLSLARKKHLALGFVGAVFDLRAAGLGPSRALMSGDRLAYGPLHGSIIGATLPIPFGGILKDRIALGLGFFTPFDLVVHGRILYPETPQFPIADRSQSVAVQAGLGVDLGHGVRIGGGFAALAALSGSVLVATDASGRIGTVVEDTLLASYGPIFGISYDLGERYRLGLTFRGELKGRFNVVIDVRDLGDITVPPLNISGIAQYDPLQLALEFARVKGPYRYALGAVYKHWSAYPGLAEATVRCPLVDPASAEIRTEPCGALVPANPDYSDTVAFRAGLERSLAPSPSTEMRLRAGLLFEPSPAPEQRGEANIYDNTRVALTLGYGLALQKPLPPITLDLFAQTHVLLPREHQKDPGVAPDNPGQGGVTTSGLIMAGGLLAGVMF